MNRLLRKYRLLDSFKSLIWMWNFQHASRTEKTNQKIKHTHDPYLNFRLYSTKRVNKKFIQNCSQRRRNPTETQNNERLKLKWAVLSVLLSTMSWPNCLEIGFFAARMFVRIESGWGEHNKILNDIAGSCRLAVYWTWKRMFWSILYTVFKGKSYCLPVCSM